LDKKAVNTRRAAKVTRIHDLLKILNDLDVLDALGDETNDVDE